MNGVTGNAIRSGPGSRAGRLMCIVALLLMALYGFSAYGDEYFSWTDENGNLHFSDSMQNVPEKYRDQIQTNTLDEKQTAPAKPPPKSAPTMPPAVKNPSVPKPPKRYEVPYKPHEGSAKRIIVTAVFNGAESADLIIDTGATSTMISPSLAKKLGLLDQDEAALIIPVGGIGGEIPAIRSIVDTIQVGGAVTRFVPVVVSPSVSKSFEGLLGLDFVSSFAVTIDAKRNVVVFEELPVDAEHPGGHDREWWSGLYKEFGTAGDYWREYRETYQTEMLDSPYANREDVQLMRFFIDYEITESGKLMDKLDRFARENAVPMTWRDY